MIPTKKLQLRDIIVMSAISIVFGILYLVWIFAAGLLSGVLGPMGGALLSGLWIMACIVCAYIIRKPGVAFMGEMIAAFTEVLIGSVSAGSVLLLGFTQGIGCEIVFALFLWRRYWLPILMLAGMGGTTANFVTSYFISGYSQLAPGLLVAMLGVMLVSGALAAWLSKGIADKLAQTGVLNSFALGREKLQKERERKNHGLRAN
ncbi:energy-coupling factor transport system substrate-specific component [Geomicrobium halophilum]|uniref:Energy-coupling factor transport system substrate-specific component n=1 Tax=Geomicrobium halophilum TaxID=549000 RepID=A0A841PN70_9BACL|nr:ECF transporter S component [Geomicrobium halophilum]MBB6450297.1 energy-coupling factor transport system substrate-specific component [Geomicrobium halophilum]